MRNILSIGVLASLSFALPTDSDACGAPDPTVLQLTSTWGRTGATRTFALTSGKVTGTPSWKQLAPGTYDYSSIAPAPRLAAPMTITLLGKSGTRVVSSRDQVFMQHSFVRSTPGTALEIPAERGEFSFALVGKHTDATWLELDSHPRSDADLTWVTAQGFAPINAEYVSVDQIAGTELETVSSLTKDKQVTLVRNHGQVVAQFDGHPMGAFTLYGMTYVVAINGRDTVWAEPIY